MAAIEFPLARLVDEIGQPTLFNVPSSERRMLSQIRDNRTSRLVTLARRIEACTDDLKRATMLIELATLTAEATARAVRRANAAGMTWREIGSRVGLPYQTLYRRYRKEEL